MTAKEKRREYINRVYVTQILKLALAEDLCGDVDITTRAVFDAKDKCAAEIRSKQNGVLSGVTWIKPLFELVDSYFEERDPRIRADILLPSFVTFVSAETGMPLSSPSSKSSSSKTKIELLRNDGDALRAGDVICKLRGPVHSILTGERTILNLLQRLSGIATMTKSFVDAMSGANNKTKLLDTRKTTPAFRILEKSAVLHGGGENHRFGLYDMMLIKDTHVRRAGGAKNALLKAIAYRGDNDMPHIEIEVQSTEEFLNILPLAPDRIMLDNMSIDDMKFCVAKRDAQKSKTELEASGNVSIETIKSIAETGVDFISSGAITHSAPALDIHLVIV